MKLSIVDKDGNPIEVTYATKYSAGFDIKADLSGRDPKSMSFILDGGAKMVPTGLYLKAEGEPEGNTVPALFITPRSGKSLAGFRVSNSPGLIDADYEGEIMVIIDRDKPAKGGLPVTISHGDKIAQGVFIQVPRFDIKVEDVERGKGGFGSTDSKKIDTPPIKKK